MLSLTPKTQIDKAKHALGTLSPMPTKWCKTSACVQTSAQQSATVRRQAID